MSKIILTLTSGLPNGQIPSFFEGFARALKRSGNEVLIIVNNNILRNCWKDNVSDKKLDKNKLNQKITEFNPDLIISSNNSLYEEIPNLVSCPILIYGVDSPAVFLDKDGFKENLSRYHIGVASFELIEMTKEYFGTNYQSLNLIHFATDYKSEKIEQDKNISFIGTNFDFANCNFKKVIFNDFNEEKRTKFNLFYDSFLQDILKNPEYHLEKNSIDKNFLENISHIDLLNMISNNVRIQTLIAVSDLGLALYGSKNWTDLCGVSLDLARSYINKDISSIKDNEDIYNSSKISINITHAQAGSAFSWRVRDVMACNSVLISDPRKDLETQFGKYVKIPTYQNPFEARKLCEKLLQDEKWRQEIVIGSQMAINENHRFEHRFKDIEQIIGVKLFENDKEGNIEILDENEFLSSGFLGLSFLDFKIDNLVVDDKVVNRNCNNIVKFLKFLNRKRINIFGRIKGRFKCKYCNNWNK